MNINMKQLLQLGRFRMDKGEDNALGLLGPQMEVLYSAIKSRKDIHNEIYKKMSAYCVNNYTNSDEKKIKKNAFEILSATLMENDKKSGDDLVTKEIMMSSAKTLEDLSKTTKEFDKKLSSNVIKSFQDFYEDSSLSAMKKNLLSINKEIKTREDKLHSIQDQLNNQSMENSRKSGMEFNVTNEKLLAAMAAEENSEKELEIKRDLQRQKTDLFVTKLFEQESERVQIGEKMLEFFETYLDFFVDCQNILTKFIPDFKKVNERNRQNYVFNLPIDDHIKVSERKLSVVLETCIQSLDTEDNLKQEGLFRVSGSKSKVDLLKNAINISRADENILKTCDASVFASVLKQYLRELPVPLMTYNLYEKWCEASMKYRQNQLDQTKEIVKECLNSMPKSHYDNLVYLLQFLRKITDNQAVNKMSASNLGLVIGPNLIRPPPINQSDSYVSSIENSSESGNNAGDVSKNMMIGTSGANIVEYIIVNFHELFPDAPVYKTAPSLPSPVVNTGMAPSTYSTNNNYIPSLKPTPDTEEVVKSHSRKGSLNTASNLDTDSLSSCDQNLDDNANNESGAKISKEAGNLRKFLRKAPAPPPPPSSALSSQVSGRLAMSMDLSESNLDTSIDSNKIQIRSSDPPGSGAKQPPQIKKRFSKLEKSPNLLEPNNLNPNENNLTHHETPHLYRSSTVTNQPRPPQMASPVIPSKRPTDPPPVSPSQQRPPLKPRSTELIPPKRPANPPPPIPAAGPTISTNDTINVLSTESPLTPPPQPTTPRPHKSSHKYSKSDAD